MFHILAEPLSPENIYRLLLREQELRETRCLYEEICSGGGTRNYFKSQSLYRAQNSLFREGKVGIFPSPKASTEGKKRKMKKYGENMTKYEGKMKENMENIKEI